MTDDEVKPWMRHEALQLDRLVAVGTILWRVADDIALRMQPERGDGPWGAGTARFERSVHQIAKAAVDQYRDWLSVSIEDGVFLVKIGGVPVRFYRGDEDLPTPSRYSKRKPGEVRDLQYALGLGEDGVPDLLRFEVQVDANQHPTAIVFVQIDINGDKRNPFVIPINKKAASRAIARKRAAVPIPEPKVGPKKPDKEVPALTSKEING